MHHHPGILTALVFAVLAYFLVIASINLALRQLGESARFPVLPRFSNRKAISPGKTEFEQFVIDRFDPGHFRLSARKTELSGGLSIPAAEGHPDLVYEAILPEEVLPFAIGCIWRPAFTGGLIDLSSENPFPGYRKYSEENAIPVFLVIGIGGTPGAPEASFVLPLTVVQPHFTHLTELFLGKYRRPQGDSVFFLDTRRMSLR